jgi:hypothetical protein
MEQNDDDMLAIAVRQLVEAVCETLRTPQALQRGLFETLSPDPIVKGLTQEPSMSLDPKGQESPITERVRAEIEDVLWEELARSSNPRVQAEVALHRSLSLPVFKKLAEHPDYLVRWSLVLNPHLPSALLPNLAKDSVDFIRREVARHPDTDCKILDTLAHDSILHVRLAVASNTNTEWRTLKGMRWSEPPSIRRAISNHPNNPERPRNRDRRSRHR